MLFSFGQLKCPLYATTGLFSMSIFPASESENAQPVCADSSSELIYRRRGVKDPLAFSKPERHIKAFYGDVRCGDAPALAIPRALGLPAQDTQHGNGICRCLRASGGIRLFKLRPGVQLAPGHFVYSGAPASALLLR